MRNIKEKKQKILGFVKRQNQDEEQNLLNKIHNNDFTEEELFKYASEKKTLLFLLRNGYTNIIHYIVKKEYMFIELENGKTIIELFFEQFIQDPEILNDIKRKLSSWDTIPLTKRKEDKWKGKKTSPKYFNLKTFLNELIKDGFLDKLNDRGVPIRNGLLKDMLYNESMYRTLYFYAELLVREYFFLSRFVSKSEITSFLLEKDIENNAVLDCITLCALDDRIAERELKDNKQVVEYYLAQKSYKKLLKYCGSKMLLSKGINHSETYLDRIIKGLFQKGNIDILCEVQLDPEIYVYQSIYLNHKPLIKAIIDSGRLKKIIELKDSDENFWIYKLDRNTTMLDYLLSVDKKTIINAIKNNEYLMGNPQIHLTINQKLDHKLKYLRREKGIDNIINNFSKSFYAQFFAGELSDIAYEKIYTFKQIMLYDGKSDEEIIDLACSAFATLYIHNHPYADREVDNAILLKTFNGDFCLKYDPNENKSKFKRNENTIVMNDMYSIDVFNHEFAHAVHFAFGNKTYECPVLFQKYLKAGPSKLTKIRFSEVKRSHIKNEEYIEKTFISPYIRSLDFGYLFNNYQTYTKEALQKARESGNYDNRTLEIAFSPIMNKDEYKQIHHSLICDRMNNIISRDKNIVESIMDSMSNGAFHSRGISTDGKIESVAGHGEDYFRQKENQGEGIASRFAEIYADFTAILKRPNNDEALSELRFLVGEEFIDNLHHFYRNLDLKDIYFINIESKGRAL